MLTRFDHSDGLGAIYPPMVWSTIALKCLGYPDDSPEVQYCYEELRKLTIEDPQTGAARLQPCKSPVWDTALAVRALAASGVRPENPALREAIAWLRARQIKRRGDWTETVAVEPGGWCFEYANDFYPDCDDTAMVLMALETQFSGPTAANAALPPELRLAPDGTHVQSVGQTFLSASSGTDIPAAGCNREEWPTLADRNVCPPPGSDAGQFHESTTGGSANCTTRCRPSPRASAGCWPCRTATAAGGPSTATTTASSSATSPSPTTTP